MKHVTSLALLLTLVGCTLPAQTPDGPPPPLAASPADGAEAPVLFTAEQLDQLLAPIALYPDALLALILPASTNPSEIVLAARFLQAGGLPGQVDLQPWDDSVRGLAHYPQVLRWMDENLAWTKQLGDAFAAQPGDVMNAVQRLRARARAAGTLGSTAQQQVIYEGDTIVIVPTDPEVIYVPYYDPARVYETSYYSTPSTFFSYSAGFTTGWWMCYGLDWNSRRIWAIHHNDRERYWREHQRDWHRNNAPAHADHDRHDVYVWQPRREWRGGRPSTASRTVHVTPSAGTDRTEPARPERRDVPSHPWRQPSSRTSSAPPQFTGPTSPARSGMPTPPPATFAPSLTPTPGANAPSPSAPDNRHFNRPGDSRGRGDNRPVHSSPRNDPMPENRPAVPGYQSNRPIVPPMTNANVMPPPRPAPEARPAPEPRHVPAMHYTPPPQPPPQAPSAAPSPQDQPPQSQPQQSGESGRRPFIRR